MNCDFCRDDFQHYNLNRYTFGHEAILDALDREAFIEAKVKIVFFAVLNYIVASLSACLLPLALVAYPILPYLSCKDCETVSCPSAEEQYEGLIDSEESIFFYLGRRLHFLFWSLSLASEIWGNAAPDLDHSDHEL